MYSQINGIYFSHTGILSTPFPFPESPTTADTATCRASATTTTRSSYSLSSEDRRIDSNSNDNEKREYDVFLSFSGQDTRHNFTVHLHTALTNAGFSAFIDEERLEKGETIRPGLMEAIKGSKISIVVLSPKYAYSTWCLDELDEIMECWRNLGRVVLPIIYCVDPMDVRKQSGQFAGAFRQHGVRFRSDSDQLRRWRLALSGAANLNGWEAKNWRNEADLIKDIVGDVSRKLLGATNLSVARRPIEIDSRVQELKSLLKVESDDEVHIVDRSSLPKAVNIYSKINGIYFNHTGNLSTLRPLPGSPLTNTTVNHKASASLSSRKGRIDLNSNSNLPSDWNDDKYKKDYDVFLSFRGQDTRHTFTIHLYNALTNAGFSIFMGLEVLGKGEMISRGLLKAIEDSKISIVVLSSHYANSFCCLEELTRIMECRRTLGQMVLTIFYGIEPTEVRKQRGPFARVFRKLDTGYRDEVQRWRLALTDAGNLTGWDAANWRNEADLIKDIARDVSRKLLGAMNLSVSPYTVGIDSRVLELSSLLKVDSDDEVRIVGVCAMGGMGKTTIAKAIYNMFNIQFGSNRSFLENVRQIWDQPNRRVRLQNQLLRDILKNDNEKVGSVDRGIKVIEKRLCHKKVLVIVDDVEHKDQVNAIAGSRGWFGPGSRIIITTRNLQLLKEVNVDFIYGAPEMNDVESLKLFSLHAFREEEPDEEYFELSRIVVNYCGRLPLALQVLGSFLSGQPTRIWESALEKLRTIPDKKVNEKLKISFDALSDDMVKDIFLDISCFFIGMDRNYVKEILDGCGLHAEIGLKLLLERCLITVSERNKLMMHDLLRDMGRAIVREQSIKEPGKRSRLWLQEDVYGVLTDETGTESVEGLSLEMERLNKASFTTKAFVKMQELRLLKLNHVRLDGSYEYLSKRLRWLCWNGFPLKHIPSKFNQRNLVAINLKYSNLRQVWKDPQLLDKLKILNLSHSNYLTRTPDFLYLPNLGKLILKDCKSLYEVHHSIGNLGKLVLVNLRDCKILKELPLDFYKLKSLETLILSGCSMFERFADKLGELASLKTLLADNTGIREIPYTIGQLTSLTHLSLCGLGESPANSTSLLPWLIMPKETSKSMNLLPPSLCGLKSLTILSLMDCNLTDDALPKDLGCLSSLVTLRLDNNNFHHFPSSLNGLTRLRSLSLDNCKMLQSIPDLPTNLKALYAANCIALERMPNMSEMSNLVILELANCHELVDIQGFDKLLMFLSLQLQSEKITTTTSHESFLQVTTRTEFGGQILHADDIPEWFTHSAKGSSISFDVPPLVDYSLKGILVRAFYSYSPKPMLFSAFPIILVVNKTQRRNFTFDLVALSHHVTTSKGYLWQGLISSDGLNFKGGDKVEVNFDFGAYYTVEKTGIYLLLDYDLNNKMIQYGSVADEDATFLSDYEDAAEDQESSGSMSSLGEESRTSDS